MNDTERLVSAAEDLTAAIERLADHMGGASVEPAETPTADAEKAMEYMENKADEPPDMDPVDALTTHMESHGVNTTKVETTTEGFKGKVYFEEVWEEMSDDEVQTFREYTMNQDHVDVYQWVERNGNNFPNGFTVDIADLEGLV